MTRRAGKKSTSLFYIFTEGEVTEKQYFDKNSFGERPRADRKFPIINKGGRRGNDSKSMQMWVENTLSTVRIRKNDFVWIVIDKDENDPEDLRALSDWCNQKGYKLALSSPLFEFWFAIHFQYIEEAFNKEDIYECLNTRLGCRYNKTDDYKDILSNYTDAAIKNAKNLRKKIGRDQYCTHVPFTNVDRLVEDIRDFMRRG
jgi:hypothetical protein